MIGIARHAGTTLFDDFSLSIWVQFCPGNGQVSIHVAVKLAQPPKMN
jgi:hypothetical protein